MLTGTNLEDEDVTAKNVMDINGRTVSIGDMHSSRA